jgi:hypothetical protein
MSNSVADLFACWWTRGRPRSAIVWNMVPFALCGVYGGKEMRVALSTLEELTSFFFFTLFTWTTPWLAPLVISFSDFLVLFSSPN